MRTTPALLVLLALACCDGSTRAARPVPRGRTAQPTGGGLPPSIVNRVVDLLDHPVLLDQSPGHVTWESASFDTAPFDTIVVKPAADMIGGLMDCEVAWQVGPDDDFVDPLDYTFDPTFFPVLPAAAGPVRGTAGKVFCHASPPPDPLGDDRGGPGSGAGTLTDVKVLLRRK